MFVSGNQDRHVDIGKNKKTTKRRIDNYSMRTYIYRDYESQRDDQGSSAAPGSDFWNLVVLLLLYTIQGTSGWRHVNEIIIITKGFLWD
jgi:hypothetical protein